jgi:hypothetical protein
MAGDFEGNPFASEEGINPFADPSVAQATEPPPSSSGGDEYNPFEEGKSKKEDSQLPRIPPPPTKAEVKAKNKAAKNKNKSQAKKAPDVAPAIMRAEDDRPPAYTSGVSVYLINFPYLTIPDWHTRNVRARLPCICHGPVIGARLKEFIRQYKYPGSHF